MTRRPKYGCRACEEGVVQASDPARLIEGGLPTEATVAHVVVSKYAARLPFYRQAQIYARQGVGLDRSTVADWTGRAAWMLRPSHERLLERLKASEKLFADKTTAPVLNPGRGRTKTGQLWAYARDKTGTGLSQSAWPTSTRPTARPNGPSHTSPVARRAAGGRLRGLPRPADQGQVRLAFCFSHVRRRFCELAAAGPAPIATEALKGSGELYTVETDIGGLFAEERRSERQAGSPP